MARAKSATKSRNFRAKSIDVRREDADERTANPGLPFPVVSIGASAGGLAAFTELLKALPSKTGMAFVLIQHLEPKHESALTSLLSKATSMPVAEVSDRLAVAPNHVYIIPPNKNLAIREGSLLLTPRSKGFGLQRPIDEFTIALAEEQGNAAIGVVLSGTGSDGTNGLEAIKAAGGVTFAQDPKTAQWPAMPANAITAGAVDFILSPKRIAAELARISRHPYLAEELEAPDGAELDKVCLILRSSVGVDFRLYKQATVRRRIARRMALQKIESLKKYAQILKQHPEEAQALADDIFIAVTSFFRDPECFQALRKKVLAKFVLKRAAEDPIRIWVAGCSTGEEVYSIAMLLLEELGERANQIKIQIFGTDIEERAVAHARAGIYTEAAIAGVSPARLNRFFVKTDEGYQIQQFIRELCVFAPHDLSKDPPFSRLDLISCRNVLIYMGPALQKRVLSIFQYALKPGGFLFLGSSESIGNHSDAFTAEDRKNRIFLREPAAAAFQEFPSAAAFKREPDAAALRTSAPSLAIDFRKEAERVLLEQYAPPALVVDPDLRIVYFQGDLSRYLAPATGQPSFHLLKMVRRELVVDLRTLIAKARSEDVIVQKDGVQFKHEGQPAAVRLEVQPLKKRNAEKPDLLVVFQKIEPASLLSGVHEGKISAGKKHSVEELQSTSEELETAREELQSSNEELVTLNDELQHRNTELNVLMQDVSNLLVGIDIPVLVLDAGLCVRRFTPMAGTLLNLIPGDVGRPFSNIAPNFDVADWNSLFSEVIGQGRLIEREISSRDGRRYSLRMRPYKTIDNRIEGVLVVFLDMETISRARDAAQESGDLARTELGKRDSTIRALLDAAPQSIVGVSADEKIVLVNGNTEKMFGYPPAELIGQRLEILVPESARERHAKHLEVHFANMQSRPMGTGLKLDGRRKDGTLFPAEIDLSVIETSAGKLGVAFVSDLTQRKRLEHAAQASAQMETVGALASSIAHDFNNLLGGILAHAELALEELAVGSNPLEELHSISTAAIRGSEIVRQLMVYAGEEAETLRFLDLSATVKDMLELLKVSVSKHVRVETDLSERLRTVRANPAQVRQIVMNLFTNASEAIGDQDGVIRVTTAQVAVGSDSPLAAAEQLPAGDYAQLEVSDNGRGMTRGVQARVFELFFTTKASGSHGLGLAGVQWIVQRLHGSIRFSSAPGKGTTFQILLPCAKEMASATSSAPARAGDEIPAFRGETILVVEDEDLLRQGVSKMLQKRGLSVLEAGDGSAALDLIRARKGDIDLLVLDITLPGASSRDVYEEAKRLNPDLPVIVTSAKSEELAAASLATGVDFFLRKPVSIDDLIETIRKAFADRRSGTMVNLARQS